MLDVMMNSCEWFILLPFHRLSSSGSLTLCQFNSTLHLPASLQPLMGKAQPCVFPCTLQHSSANTMACIRLCARVTWTLRNIGIGRERNIGIAKMSQGKSADFSTLTLWHPSLEDVQLSRILLLRSDDFSQHGPATVRTSLCIRH